MRLSKVKKLPLSLLGTVVLTLILSFMVVNTFSTNLLAGSCAIGGCDCGDCANCDKFGGRILVMGVPVVVYGCSCGDDLPACQGTAL